MKRPTLRGTKWLGSIPVEAACTACENVKFIAQGASHRPSQQEYTESLQRQFEQHVKEAHWPAEQDSLSANKHSSG